MKEKIYKNLPTFFQNILITIFNFIAYRKRYGGKYSYYLKMHTEYKSYSLNALKKIQADRLKRFLNGVVKDSFFYSNSLSSNNVLLSDISLLDFDILTKAHVQKDLLKIKTIDDKAGIKSKTGGTTGKSLEVIFTKDNLQERFAILDSFRASYGYAKGKKTAWFSGKRIIFDKDVKNNVFYKTDYLHNVRYYSTFHIKEEYLKYYLDNLIKYKPEFISGFPSSISAIANYGIKNSIKFPANTVRAIFSTAETMTPTIRLSLETFFKTKVFDQYASSEGAPFIFECKNQKMHLQLQTGVFEVLDNNFKAADEGKLVVTSFTTDGTPLVRYDIGDSVTMSYETCNCGDNNPIVDRIIGRQTDFVFSPENGEINLGNISNILKNIKGVQKFQVQQDKLNEIEIILVVDKCIFSEESEKLFFEKWEYFVGSNMKIAITYADEILNETNGKYKIVKNNIKHLI